jgi:DNA-binding NarL/FixJ family response regulator
MIKILIVDDHQIIRDGLSLYLQNCVDDLDIRVADSCSTGRQALQVFQHNPPDVVLLDYSLPDMNGDEVMQRMLDIEPDMPVVFLTGNTSTQMAEDLLNSGARGFVGKSLGAIDVVDAITTVMRGGIYVDASFSNLNIRPLLKKKFGLSERECQILKLIASGRTGYEIADHLNISQKTVSTYKKRIREKLDVENNMDLIRLALQYRQDDIACSE